MQENKRGTNFAPLNHRLLTPVICVCTFTFDLFVKHMLFYSGGKINLGIEILPIKKMQTQMSSGVAYYEGEVYNVMRQGRNSTFVRIK